MISTFIFGSFSFASTVARANVWPGTTQASHTTFMAAKLADVGETLHPAMCGRIPSSING